MPFLKILRDNREQKPWNFENVAAEIEDVTLTTGDYSMEEFCNYDEGNDTYTTNYAIERKAGEDFVNSITHSRDRFLNEIKRASDWDSELQVLIEEPKTLFKRQQGFMQYRDVSPAAIFGTIEDWERYYNVKFRFVGTRERGQRIAFDALSSRLRSMLTTES